MILGCNVPHVDGYSSADIGRRVRAYRRAAGLTAEQLAERVDGMTGNAVAKLENGHRKEVSTDLLVQLAWALQVPPMVLLFPLENPNGRIEIGDRAAGTSEGLGHWFQGLAVPGAETSAATRLGNAVLSENRRLASTANGFLEAMQHLIDLQDTPDARDVVRQREADLKSEGMHSARQSLSILRDQLGLGDG